MARDEKIAAAVGAVAAVAAIIWILNGGGRTIGRAAGSLPGEVFAGAVEGIGESIGIPVTDEERCTQALAEGRLWDASFYCPAGRFLREGIF